MATNKIKATVINLEQEVPKSGGSPWLMISEKAAAAAMSSERPGMVAGSAQSLVGPKVAAGPAVALAAPATGAAILDTIKGVTLKWNQFLTLTPGTNTLNGVTVTINSDNSVTLSTDAGGATADTDFLLKNYFAAGRTGAKILITGATGGSPSTYFLADIYGGLFTEVTSPTIVIPTNITIQLGLRVKSGFTATTPITIYIYATSLTTMFGAGNEPTAAKFAEMFPESYYASNPGTLLPLRISGLESKDADDAELATLSLPVVGKTAKDGDGNPIVPYPTGMNGTPTDYDTATKDGGTIKWGVRAYEAGDESDATVITDLTNTAYPLDTPVPFTWDEPLEMVAPVEAGGVLGLQPEGVDEQGIPATAPISADIKWPLNAVSADTLTNLLDALKTAGVITAYTMTWDAAAGAYTFTIS